MFTRYGGGLHTVTEPRRSSMPLPKIPRVLSGTSGRSLPGRSGSEGASARIVQTTPEEWTRRITANPDRGNVFQGPAFAAHKAAYGWEPVHVVVDLDGTEIAVTILTRSVPGFGAVWYAPKGPGTTTVADTARAAHAIGELARTRGAFLLKIEPELLDSPGTRAGLTQAGLEETWNVQPNGSTVILDIAPDLEEIEASFHRGTRYNIRKARKGAVSEVVPVTDESCATFLDLFEETAEGRFGLRSREYYTSMWKKHAEAGQGCFVFGSIPDPDDETAPRKVVCCDFVMLLGTKGSRKDAASMRRPPVRGVPALNVLEAIRWLKEHGATEYDLCSSPPSDRIKDEAHPLHGVGQFKTGFRDEVTDFVGCWDLPLNPAKHRLWNAAAEGAVLRLHLKRTGENWY